MVRSAFVSLLLLAATFSGASAQPAKSLAAIGAYSNIHQDGEHCSGYEVDLWRAGAAVYGILRACSGMVGDQKSAGLEDAVYDRRTGRLTFHAKLSLGSDFLKDGRQVDSQDVFSFTGSVLAGQVSGSLRHQDLTYEPAKATTARIRLRKTRTALKSYASVEEWRNAER